MSYIDVFGRNKLVEMKNIFYVKESNLISYSKITENKTIISKNTMTKNNNNYGKLKI